MKKINLIYSGYADNVMVIQEENMFESLKGARTIISAFLAFVVTMGAISQGEADQINDCVLAILSLLTLASTVYFRLQAKK